MGFLDSLGIEFIDDDAVDNTAEDILGTEPEQEDIPKQAQPKAVTSSSKLSSYTKEDLIVFMMILLFGTLGGFAYANLLKKKEAPICTQPHYPPFHHSSTEKSEEKKVQEIKHSPAVKDTHKRRATRRHGYYEDEHGDLVLDPPTLRNQWQIDWSSDGTIIDARMLPDSEEVF